MASTVFYSWQSDRDPAVTRTLIQRALEGAVRQLKDEPEIAVAERALSVDRDTLGVGGTPHVAQTILDKIDAASVFVADLTYVAVRESGGGVPNPNVLIEYGWASKALGRPAMIAVMNTAFGDPKTQPLPFDLQHLRWPMLFDCPSGADRDQRKASEADLTKRLAGALKTILTDPARMAEFGPAAETVDRAAMDQALQDMGFAHNRGAFPSIVPKPRVTIQLLPHAALGAPLLKSRRAVKALRQVALETADEPDPALDSDDWQWWMAGAESQREGKPKPDCFWRLRVAAGGFLEYQGALAFPVEDDDAVVQVPGRQIELTVQAQVHRLMACALALGLDGGALLWVVVDGADRLQLIGPGGPGRRFNRPDVVLTPVTLPSLSAPMPDAVGEAFDVLWRLGGWPEGSPYFGILP